MVAATEVEPLELAEIRREVRSQRLPCAREGEEILLAQRMEMEPADTFEVLGLELVDREAEAAMRRARIIARHLALGVERVQPEADIEPSAQPGEIGAEAVKLVRGVEDDMVGQPADLWQILGLVGGAVSGDLAAIVFSGKARFPQARGAHAIKVFANQRRGAPHRECLECGEDLDPGAVLNVGEDREVGAQACGIDHEGGAVYAGEIEPGKGPGIASSGFHQNASGPGSSLTCHGRP